VVFERRTSVQFIFVVVAWCVLLAIAWPLALLVLVLLPVVWLLSLPFRLVGVVIGAAFALIKALLFLPARVLGQRGT
jgi:uncharacterized membrane protein YgaE (UPF0421/DUF939 family)